LPQGEPAWAAPLPGEELQKLVAGVAAISPAILEKVRSAYATQK
jgi:hypothetical protein